MIVLGIHMGHDAAVTVLVDGRVQSLIERERRTRIKHAAIATMDDIDAALADAGISIKDVDRIAVTTTQNWPFLFVEPEKFSFVYAPDDAADVVTGIKVAGTMTGTWADWAKTMAGQAERGRTRLRNFQTFPDTKDLFGQLSGERPVDPSEPESEVLFTQQFPYFPRPWAQSLRSEQIRPAARALCQDRVARSDNRGVSHPNSGEDPRTTDSRCGHPAPSGPCGNGVLRIRRRNRSGDHP